MREIISIDIETTDPNIMKMGPGEVRRDGHILGVGVQIKDKAPDYFITDHAGKKDSAERLRKLRNILADPCPKVCHNAAYDVPWLQAEGYVVNGKVHDTLIAASLLDEYAGSYSLDSLANKYLGERKGDDEIRLYADTQGWKGPPQSHLEKMPVEMVGKYCRKDAEQTLRLLDIFLITLGEELLRDIYELEISLFPLLRKMRRVGIRMDTAGLNTLSTEVGTAWAEKLHYLQKTYGDFNIRSGAQIAEVLDHYGLEYPETAKGNPKLGKAELAKIEGVGPAVLAVRELATLQDNFLKGAFPNFMLDGRLHPQFVQTKRDEGGAVSGRFACRNPNLQQVPVRNPYWGPRIRGLFIPEEGMDLLALDYDGIESRVFAHFAQEGDTIRKAYNDNPELDYHQAVADMAGIERPAAKTINFAALYGAGAKKLTAALGQGEDEGMRILNAYHKKFPAVRATMAWVEQQLKVDNDFIRTIGGRKARLTPAHKRDSKYYIFLNRLIQGSAADLLKKAMADAWQAGVFDVLVPHLLVHDEVVCSVPRTGVGEEAVHKLINIMETAYEFKVPIRVSGGRGKNWAEAH